MRSPWTDGRGSWRVRRGRRGAAAISVGWGAGAEGRRGAGEGGPHRGGGDAGLSGRPDAFRNIAVPVIDVPV